MENTVMESVCEFCMALSPVVYCKSDAALLCLSCDAKVHSANALSYRHPRTLVCESCRCRPAFVRCFDHQMFMCRSCDNCHHVSSQHQKKVIRSYMGCPPAIDLAALWGFNLNELGNKSNVKDKYVFASLTVESESKGGSSSQQNEVVADDNQQKNASLILQQILDLKRLQLIQGSDNSCFVRGKGQTDQLSFDYDTMWKVQLEHSLDLHSELQSLGSPHEEMTKESFLSPFSQLGHLISTENPLQGDTFWQCKSPAFNNELWSQNMQDIGICCELQCFDDLHIPDVDLTFRNFEELFGSEQDQTRILVDDKNMACSFPEEHSSFGKPDSVISAASSMCIVQSADVDKDFESSDQVLNFRTNEYPHPVQPSYSTPSFSASRITAESSSSEHKDDGIFPQVAKQKLPGESCNPDNAKLDYKENVVMRSKEKKKVRGYEAQVRHTSRKAKSYDKKRGKSQNLRAEVYESGSVSISHSF